MASRLPIGVNGLGVLLYVNEETGSFATAGLVSGAIALGMAVGGPLQSRLVDDTGLRVLNLAAFGYAAGMAGVWLFGAAGGALVPLLLAALLAGVALPSTSSVMRSRWPELLDGEPAAVKAAYALDSVLIQALVVIGPLITAGAIALGGVEWALALSVASCVAGTLAFTTLITLEGARSGEASFLHLGALASPGLRTLVYASVPLGFFIGAAEVALPAYAEQAGDPELAGALLAVFAGASIVSGLLYGSRPAWASLARTHLLLSILLPLAGLPLVLADSRLAVIVLAVVGGLPVSPVIASRNELVNLVAMPGRAAESFAWPLTAMIVGISAGVAAGGALSDAHGWSSAILAGVLAAAAGALIVALREGGLEPAVGTAPEARGPDG